MERSSEERLLEAVCMQFDVDPKMITRLVELERDNEKRLRRRGIFQSLRSIIEEYRGSENDSQEN